MARMTRAQKHGQDIHRAGIMLARMAQKRSWMSYYKEATDALNAEGGLSIKLFVPESKRTGRMQIPVAFNLPDVAPTSSDYPTATVEHWNNRNVVSAWFREFASKEGAEAVFKLLIDNSASLNMEVWDSYSFGMNSNDYNTPKTRFSTIEDDDKLTNPLPDHVSDMQKISDKFYELARREAWCSEFEQCVDKLQKILYVPLPKPATKIRKTLYFRIDTTEELDSNPTLVQEIERDYYEVQRRATQEARSVTPEQVRELFEKQEGVEIRPYEASVAVSTRG